MESRMEAVERETANTKERVEELGIKMGETSKRIKGL